MLLTPPFGGGTKRWGFFFAPLGIFPPLRVFSAPFWKGFLFRPLGFFFRPFSVFSRPFRFFIGPFRFLFGPSVRKGLPPKLFCPQRERRFPPTVVVFVCPFGFLSAPLNFFRFFFGAGFFLALFRFCFCPFRFFSAPLSSRAKKGLEKPKGALRFFGSFFGTGFCNGYKPLKFF